MEDRWRNSDHVSSVFRLEWPHHRRRGVVAFTSGTDPTFNTQLIGNNVEVSGGATIDINFNDEENYEKPPYMDLLK